MLKLVNEFKKDFELTHGIKLDFRNHVHITNQLGSNMDYYLAKDIVKAINYWAAHKYNLNRIYNTQIDIDSLRTGKLSIYIFDICLQIKNSLS